MDTFKASGLPLITVTNTERSMVVHSKTSELCTPSKTTIMASGHCLAPFCSCPKGVFEVVLSDNGGDVEVECNKCRHTVSQHKLNENYISEGTTSAMASGRCLAVIQAHKLQISCICPMGVFNIPLSDEGGCKQCGHSAYQHESYSSQGDSRPIDRVPCASLDGRFQEKEADKSSRSSENRRKAERPCFDKPRIVEEIFQRALRFRIVLFRGTPASGKTILMKLIHRHVLSACPEWVVHTFCGWPQGMNIHNSESQKFLIKKLKVHPLCAKNTLVFIDDAESSYYDENLWSFFKLLELDSAMFILFSSYGSPGECPNAISTGTSPVFAADQMISLHKEPDTYYYEPIGILLEKDEVEDLVARFLKAQSNDPHLEEDLTAYLRLISGGHAGALVGLLETVVWDPLILAKCARNGVQFTISLADFVEVFQAEPTSKRLRKGLKTKTFARGIPLRKDVQSDPSIADFLNEMAKRGSIQVSAADTQKLKAGARTAYLRGWVHKILDDYMEVYIFASPIHYWHCQALLRNHSQSSINAASPLALAIEIIKHMEPYKFALPAKNANPHSTSLPLEDWYNKEFYRASEKVLDGGVLKSPEFGITGVKGGAAMDFYLGSKKWGIELTRDGDRLYEHCSRFFQGGGNYHKWIVDGTLLDWLVLDFRSVVPSTKHSNFPKLVHICFVKAFSQVKILSNELETLDEFALINT